VKLFGYILVLLILAVLMMNFGRGQAVSPLKIFLDPKLFFAVFGLTVASAMAAFGLAQLRDALVILFIPPAKAKADEFKQASIVFRALAILAIAAGVVVSLAASICGLAHWLLPLYYGIIWGMLIFYPLSIQVALKETRVPSRQHQHAGSARRSAPRPRQEMKASEVKAPEKTGGEQADSSRRNPKRRRPRRQHSRPNQGATPTTRSGS